MKKILCIFFAAILICTSLLVDGYAENVPVAKIKEYLVAPSQYTNNEAYGVHIENTLVKNGLSSLGNFGGYVIYEFTDPIINSDKHDYGIDFIINGNAFNGAYTTQEPGQVWVSQDGNSWFALAGSEHFEDETIWDYSINYYKAEDKKCRFTDSLGECGTVSPAEYPKAEKYPKVSIPEDNLILSGILLRKQREASIKNGILTSFGYVDTLKIGNSFESSNPYLSNPANNCCDGQFDISWAVDNNGIGVNLDWIKYVKVQTATFIDGAMFGEKSTEISSVSLAYESSKENKTTAVESIQIGDKTVTPVDGQYYYETDVDSNFDVIVNAKNNSNIYINNQYGAQRHFENKPEKGIIRIIVQKDSSLPSIYYINTGKSIQQNQLKISETEKELNISDTFQLTACTNNSEKIEWSTSDPDVISVDENGLVTAINPGTGYILAKTVSGLSKSCKITVKEPVPPVEVSVLFSFVNSKGLPETNTLTVKSDISQKYGYDVAQKDHNGVSVDNPTVFDALIKMHEAIYGPAFNKYTKENYLIIESGFILKAFGKNATSSGFLINGTMPNDGIVNPAYNSCTGYSSDTAQIKDGDNILYYFYKDTDNFSDIYSWFNSTEYSTSTNSNLSLNLSGYSLMKNGLNNWNTIVKEYSFPLKNIEIYTYVNGEKVILDTTNRKGNATVKFSDVGVYTIYAEGIIKNDDGTFSPIMTAVATVSVSETDHPQRKGFLGWIVNIWNSIINFFKNIFN